MAALKQLTLAAGLYDILCIVLWFHRLRSHGEEVQFEAVSFRKIPNQNRFKFVQFK